jgi:cytochrome c oxidase subunit II
MSATAESPGGTLKIDLYEKIWMWLGSVMIALFLGVMIAITAAQAVHPPSHIETIDPKTVWDDPRFAEPGVSVGERQVEVRLITQMFAFLPSEIQVPAGLPVTFRVTSTDVIHGFQIVGTNANATVIPGYISQFTVTFPRDGEYLIVCNEFCGIGHHGMYGKVLVGTPPAAEEAP